MATKQNLSFCRLVWLYHSVKSSRRGVFYRCWWRNSAVMCVHAGVDWAPDLIVWGEGLCKQQEARAQVIEQETLLFIYVEVLVTLELHKHTTNAMCASKPLHPIHIKTFYLLLQKESTLIKKDAYQQRHACKCHLKRKWTCTIAINRH